MDSCPNPIGSSSRALFRYALASWWASCSHVYWKSFSGPPSTLIVWSEHPVRTALEARSHTELLIFSMVYETRGSLSSSHIPPITVPSLKWFPHDTYPTASGIYCRNWLRSAFYFHKFISVTERVVYVSVFTSYKPIDTSNHIIQSSLSGSINFI